METIFSRSEVLALLERENIPFTIREHPAVYTMEDMQRLGLHLEGTICKNLFLRDARGKRHFLVVLDGEKSADLKSLRGKIGSTALSFASDERLMRYLGLSPGAVTPFGVLNDEACAVKVIFDAALRGRDKLGFHPNDNTATVFVSFDDMMRIVSAHGNETLIVQL